MKVNSILPKLIPVIVLFVLINIFFTITLSTQEDKDDKGGKDILYAKELARNWLITPNDLAFDNTGNILVSASLDNRVAVISRAGRLLYYYELDPFKGRFESTCVATTQSGRSFALNSLGLYELNTDKSVTKLIFMTNHPTHMCAGDGETLYYIADVGGRGTLFKISLTPKINMQQVASVPETFYRCITRGPDNNFYATSSNTGKIIRFSPNGDTAVFKTGLADNGGPIYLAFTPDKTLFVSDQENNRLLEIDLQGRATVLNKFESLQEMLFLPDKSYFVLNKYESVLFKYDTKGNRKIIQHGKIGRGLTAMPNGGLLGYMQDMGAYEYYPTGSTKASTIADFFEDKSYVKDLRYVFDEKGNIYYFKGSALYKREPLGKISIINNNIGCHPVYYHQSIDFCPKEQAIYATCFQNSRQVIMRFSLDGKKSIIYENPYHTYYMCLDVDILGNVYYGYYRLNDQSVQLLKIDRNKKVEQVFYKLGHRDGMIIIACSQTSADCYFSVSPEPFNMYHTIVNGNINKLRSDTNILGVDFQGLATTKGGHIYMIAPGVLYRFSGQDKTAKPLSISPDLPPIKVKVGQITDIEIPGTGFLDDTAVETNAPGCWIYQREVKNKSLKFKLAVSTVCKPGEYDIILHQPDAEKLVLKGKLKITGSK